MFKNYLKAILGRLGYSVVRRGPSEANPHQLVFGPYRIHSPSLDLVAIYKKYPEMNQSMARILRLLGTEKSPLSMIDIGANCGDTLAIAKLALPEVEILAVEGDRDLLEVLNKNCQQFTGIDVRDVFLGESERKIEVSIQHRGSNDTLVDVAGGGEIINLKTLDQVVSTWNALSKLRLLKSDTEGFDVRILIGARNTLAKLQPVIFTEYNCDAMAAVHESGFRLWGFLRELGYETALFYDNFGRLLVESNLEDERLLADIHAYAGAKTGAICYYDLIIFSKKDRELARRFADAEREHRVALS